MARPSRRRARPPPMARRHRLPWRGGVPVGTMRVDGTMAAHALEIAIPPGGADLALALRSPTTTVPGDSRQLGVKLDTIRLEPLAYDAGAYWRALGPWLASALVLVVL